jgi:hypothetical protein
MQKVKSKFQKTNNQQITIPINLNTHHIIYMILDYWSFGIVCHLDFEI